MQRNRIEKNTNKIIRTIGCFDSQKKKEKKNKTLFCCFIRYLNISYKFGLSPSGKHLYSNY